MLKKNVKIYITNELIKHKKSLENSNISFRKYSEVNQIPKVFYILVQKNIDYLSKNDFATLLKTSKNVSKFVKKALVESKLNQRNLNSDARKKFWLYYIKEH